MRLSRLEQPGSAKPALVTDQAIYDLSGVIVTLMRRLLLTMRFAEYSPQPPVASCPRFVTPLDCAWDPPGRQPQRFERA